MSSCEGAGLQLKISPSTVRTHVESAFRKLEARDALSVGGDGRRLLTPLDQA